MQVSRISIRNATGIGLLLSAMLLTAFYCFLHLRDNALPAFDLSGFRLAAGDGFRYRIEKCRSNEKKLVAKGWLVREGHGANRRRVLLVAVDEAGLAHAVKTTLQQRDDLAQLLERTLGDRINYGNAGFAASLNLNIARLDLPRTRLFLAYDDGDVRVLLPVTCRIDLDNG